MVVYEASLAVSSDDEADGDRRRKPRKAGQLAIQ